MDFGNAVLLVGLLAGIVAVLDKVAPKLTDIQRVAANLIAGQAAVWAVAYSDWGHKSVVSGLPLDGMSAVSLALVGATLSMTAILFHDKLESFIGSVANIGENQNPQ